MARAQITNDFSVYRRWRNIVTNRVKDDETCVPEGINIAEFQMFLGEVFSQPPTSCSFNIFR